MPQLDIEKLETVIESAMKTAVRRGYRIVPTITRGTNHCCPMGAVLVASDTPGETLVDVAQSLGVERAVCLEFAMGFDGGPLCTPGLRALHSLGHKFRLAVDAGLYTRAVVCPEMP